MRIGPLSLTSYRRVRFSRCFMTSSPCQSYAYEERTPEEEAENKKNNKYAWMELIKYNSFLERYTYRPNYKTRMQEISEYRGKLANELDETYKKSPMVALKYFEDVPSKSNSLNPEQQTFIDAVNKENIGAELQFPYQIYTEYSKVDPKLAEEEEKKKRENYLSSMREKQEEQEEEEEIIDDGKTLIDRLEEHEEDEKVDGKSFKDRLQDELGEDASWIHDYGTADSSVPESNIPCGGCGALLHCKDSAIPGYIPSDTFKALANEELRTEVCQRCYFLKVHDTALNVNVDPKSYPEILNHIKDKRALVLLLVDLTDFPCSIWPGIADIIGVKRPVMLIGNKVDLLPKDSHKYLEHVTKCLRSVADDVGLNRLKIIHTQLISSTTGYGIENLISNVHNMWKMKGDIYIMGCTNVGKSTLFNVLLQSDLCKIQAVDLIQRATVSPWPGTTLNLLKFPVLRPDGWQVHVRSERLRQWYEAVEEEKRLKEFQLRETGDAAYASLIGYVGRTFQKPAHPSEVKVVQETKDLFQVNWKTKNLPALSQVGNWDPNDKAFVHGKWCYDTPGTVNENQILDKLLLPELTRTVPKTTFQPRSFYIKLGLSVFVGGLARIDVTTKQPIVYTVFTSLALPVTIVPTEHADEVYEKGLGTPIFGVPIGGKRRLSYFPPLKSRIFEVDGAGLKYSCCDLVISGAGWVAVTAAYGQHCKLTVHTPNGAGIFCRQPSLLPHSVTLRGPRKRGTLAYSKHSPYVQRKMDAHF